MGADIQPPTGSADFVAHLIRQGLAVCKIASDSAPILQYGECDSTENGSPNNSHVDNLLLNLQYISIIISQTSFVGWAAWDFFEPR